MTTYFFSGTAKWAGKKLGKYDTYTFDFYPDEVSLAAYKTSGIRVSPKTDDDGKVFYKLKRDKSLTKKDGTVIDLGPPSFLNADGTEFTGLVGNGSKVTAKVAVYPTGAGVGHRWEALRIDDLVVYAPLMTANVPTVGLPF